MKFLLDTDTCIYAMKNRRGVIKHLSHQNRSDIGLSVITEAELRTGAARSNSPGKTLVRLENFLRPLTIFEFSSQDAMTYAHIRAALESAGTPIGPLDTLIAAQALTRKLTLVTNNQREFRRIEDLSLVNWAS